MYPKFSGHCKLSQSQTWDFSIPLLMFSSPKSAPSKEDFPEPTSPTIISSCPSSTSRLMSFNARSPSALHAKLPSVTLTAAWWGSALGFRVGCSNSSSCKIQYQELKTPQDPKFSPTPWAAYAQFSREFEILLLEWVSPQYTGARKCFAYGLWGWKCTAEIEIPFSGCNAK